MNKAHVSTGQPAFPATANGAPALVDNNVDVKPLPPPVVDNQGMIETPPLPITYEVAH